MSIVTAATPMMSGPLPAPGLRAGVSAAATFLQMLEDELLHEAVPASLPPPNLPLLPPGSMPPEYPWMPLPLFVLSPREEAAAKKRSPARGDKRSGRR